MPYKFFVVPTHDSARAEAELNAFMRNHRVLTTDRRWVDAGAASFWGICVDYLDGTPPPSTPVGNGRPPGVGKGPKVDYKEVLSEAEFVVFSKLRDLREEIAKAEAVPVYTIFTNAQLAAMVQRKVTTKAAMGEVEGVGEAKVAKYGERVLEVLKAAVPTA